MRTFRYNKDTAVVKTTKGLIRGYQCDGLSIFKGVPYATAKRFHAPEELEPWEGVKETTSYGRVCPMLAQDNPNGELKVPHRYWPQHEDCQSLNIWTPGLDGKKRPVLFWLHGGGYEMGSSIEQVAYDGANMAALGDVVVVTINHRLNILGFLDLSSYGEEYANSGNAGMDDIIAALRWVRDNIAAFGGDPDCVTAFGQSGGGGKVTTLLQMPAADGLFHRGMVMSGVLGILDDSEADHRALAEALMADMGLSGVKELETVSFARLTESFQRVTKENRFRFAPVPNAFYAGNPLKVGFRKESAHVPLLVGSVFGEFMGFAPALYDKKTMTRPQQLAVLEEKLGAEGAKTLVPLFEAAYPERPLLDLLQLDFLFRAPQLPYVAARSALNHCTYSYLFNQDLALDGGSCPWHCSDIPYVFHNCELVENTWEEGVTEALERQIFESTLAFARTGDPNCGCVPRWEPCAPGQEHTMLWSKESHVVTNHDAALIPQAAKYLGVLLAAFFGGKGGIQH